MFVGSIGLAYLGYKMPDRLPELGTEEERKRFRIFYILTGGVAGFAASFFGPVIATLISIQLGGPNFLRLIDEPSEIGGLIGSLTVVGIILGYFIGKHNNFEKPKWMTKIDERYGF